MALLRLAARDARRNLGADSYSRWFKCDPDLRIYDLHGKSEISESTIASSRINNEIVYPHVMPKQSIRLSDRFFCIGSCFARRLEEALSGVGIPCESSVLFKEVLSRYSGLMRCDGHNKYNTYAMLNEISWALEPGGGFPVECVISCGDSRYGDSQAHSHIFGPQDKIFMAHSDCITNVFRKLSVCDSIIITLGLVEVWYDHETCYYLNSTPTYDQLNNNESRFSFEVMTVDDNIRNLELIYHLIRKYSLTDPKIFVTVSPVPLVATFSGRDVLMANTLSKCTLRVAAEQWCALHDDIEYVPIYEMVVNSNRNLVWEEDNAHVAADFARKITDWFLDTYLMEESVAEVAEKIAAGKEPAERAGPPSRQDCAGLAQARLRSYYLGRLQYIKDELIKIKNSEPDHADDSTVASLLEKAGILKDKYIRLSR